MERADSQLLLRVGSHEKEEWKAMAKHQGLSLSHLIRQVMRLVTKNNQVRMTGGMTEPNTKITIRLRRSEERAIREMAEVAGLDNRQAWIVALIRANLFSLPTPSYEELQELREANKQLRGVGINLNQIAHAVNIDLDHIDQLTGKTLDELRLAVMDEKNAVAAVVQQTLYRWTKRYSEEGERNESK